MRAGLSTIQQTLTPEAAAVLNQSLAEAGRRNHGQTMPLHVASALLSSPSGYLRQACIRSHPNSSHPLQCRALELCFSVALERLPSAQATAPRTNPEPPPISNALTVALRRAQAHQRRGCPEQQQQPLLAVKVELDQLIISILDDPGVSRVMREAGFSSPAVKAAIEQSLTSPSSNAHHHQHRHVGNYYLNPRLQPGPNVNMENHRGDDVINNLLEIMMRSKKRNPILVGDFSEPEAIVGELLKKVENKEFGFLKNARVISMAKNRVPSKIKELGNVMESLIGIGGVIIDMGDLRWLVEHQHQHQHRGITEQGRATVAEMAGLLARFGGNEAHLNNNIDNNKVWLIGTANCETYLRCQVYYSTMENELDLQAVPLASRSRISRIFPRLGMERFSCSPVELLNPVKAVQIPLTEALTDRVSESMYSSQRNDLCPQCLDNYEKELAKLESIKKSFCDAKHITTQPSLPQWLQNAKLNATDSKTADQSQVKDRGLISDQKTKELQKKWTDTCLHLHQDFHQMSRANILPLTTLSSMSFYDPNLITRPIFQPKLPINNSPPSSPVRTDLVLGRKGMEENFTDNQSKDLLGCISSELQTKLPDKFANALDADMYKNLLSRLMEEAWWQGEAALAVASTVTRCRLGGGKRRSRGDIWLLFVGPDRSGKRKMASVLAEEICGASLVTICLGARWDDNELSLRGKTAIDRIVEAIQRNPLSVIMLDGVDEAGALVRGSIKRAIEVGRLTDSYGREVSIGNAIFILTGNWSMNNNNNNHEVGRDGHVVSGSWHLRLVVREKSAKRRASWLHDGDERPLRPRGGAGPAGSSFDLNLAMGTENECNRTDLSHNSSDVTVDNEDGLSINVNRDLSIIMSVPHDLLDSVDEPIVFKSFNSAFVLQEIKKAISVKFSTIVGDEDSSIEVDNDVLEKILRGLLHDRTSLGEWIEKVLAPSFDRIKGRILSDERSSFVVRLMVESDSESVQDTAEWLPCLVAT